MKRSASRPAIGAISAVATGQGVMSRPVAASDIFSVPSKKNGSATSARLADANEEIEVASDNAKTRQPQQIDRQEGRALPKLASHEQRPKQHRRRHLGD